MDDADLNKAFHSSLLTACQQTTPIIKYILHISIQILALEKPNQSYN